MKKVKPLADALRAEDRRTDFKMLERGKYYERNEDERQLLHLLARGEQEITAGEGFDLEGVLVEADALLASGPK